MKISNQDCPYIFFFISLIVLLVGYSYLSYSLQANFDISPSSFTIRVNTFRRNDLLETFLDHYTTCSEVELIQVIWSDQENDVPSELKNQYSSGKVQFEKHDSDKLSNRFKALSIPPTEGVLSIDDDLLVPCRDLSQAHNVWMSNKKALVGYSPRMHAMDSSTGKDRYLRWQHTWWNGVYSIILTKISFMHRDFLGDFFSVLPQKLIETLDVNRNCEDLAMAQVVARKTGAPPVWVKGVVYEEAIEGISSGTSHFSDRSECLTLLKEYNGGDIALAPAYQKAVPLSGGWEDWKKLFATRNF